VANPNIIKVFYLYDSDLYPEMYLLMEKASMGQIQVDSPSGSSNLVAKNKEIYETAVQNGLNCWPK
jgi:hypothetical protein